MSSSQDVSSGSSEDLADLKLFAQMYAAAEAAGVLMDPPVVASASPSIEQQYFVSPQPMPGLDEPTCFWLVVVEEAEIPTAERFDTKEELAARMSEFMGDEVYLFPYVGKRIRMTNQHPWRIQLPDGELIDVTPRDEDSMEWCDDGFVGTRPQLEYADEFYDESEDLLDEPEDDDPFGRIVDIDPASIDPEEDDDDD